MKGDGQWGGQFDQFARACNVDRVLRRQNPEPSPTLSRLLGGSDGDFHGCEFRVRVDEPAAPRTDHGKDRQAHTGADCGHQPQYRRYSSRAQIAAQFEARGSAAFGGLCAGQTLYTDFQDDFLRQMAVPLFIQAVGPANRNRQAYPLLKRICDRKGERRLDRFHPHGPPSVSRPTRPFPEANSPPQATISANSPPPAPPGNIYYRRRVPPA